MNKSYHCPSAQFGRDPPAGHKSPAGMHIGASVFIHPNKNSIVVRGTLIEDPFLYAVIDNLIADPPAKQILPDTSAVRITLRQYKGYFLFFGMLRRDIGRILAAQKPDSLYKIHPIYFRQKTECIISPNICLLYTSQSPRDCS